MGKDEWKESFSLSIDGSFLRSLEDDSFALLFASSFSVPLIYDPFGSGIK